MCYRLIAVVFVCLSLVFLDTREQRGGAPLLHEMGSAISFDVFGGDSSTRLDNVQTPILLLEEPED